MMSPQVQDVNKAPRSVVLDAERNLQRFQHIPGAII
jgi:hypothetical protein